MRNELLNGKIFYTLREAQVKIEPWRQQYNLIRPHGAPACRPSAPKTMAPKLTMESRIGQTRRVP